MRKTLWAVIVPVLLLSPTNARLDTSTDTNRILSAACNLYSQYWISLNQYYKKGRQEFDRRCRNAIESKNLLAGLWAVRAMVQDGHADFSIKSKNPSLIHPVIMNYDPDTKKVSIATVLDKSLAEYVGKTVISVNSKDAVRVISERASIEPQSVPESAMVVAARTLLYQPEWHPYLDFPDEVDITFDNGDRIATKPMLLKDILKKDPHVLSRNAYPSIWGGMAEIEHDACISDDEIAKVITYRGAKWLWWHPKSMLFHANRMEDAFTCWSREIEKADRVILDLRDTAGGRCKELMAISSMFGAADEMVFYYNNSRRNADTRRMWAPEGTPKHWTGKTIMITNGICGSMCDQLATNVAERKGVCSYGTPTAGRRSLYDDIDITNNVTVSIPTAAIFNSGGDNLEGKPFVPKHKGSGGVYQAIDACMNEL